MVENYTEDLKESVYHTVQSLSLVSIYSKLHDHDTKNKAI